MPTDHRGSTVLTLRVPPALSRRLNREAKRRRVTRSEAARAILEQVLEGRTDDDLVAEARRQSQLAAATRSETEALEFVAGVADTRGWT
jgi:predicted transcriptional regulator